MKNSCGESEKLRRYKKEARLPVAKTLSEYDFASGAGTEWSQFRQLCETTDWVDAGENVLLFGASGLGKSHLAAAIVDGVVGQGYRARFTAQESCCRNYVKPERS